MSNTSGCLGKIAYVSRAAAERAKDRLIRKPGYVKGGPDRRSAGLGSYFCDRCRHFHLGRDKRSGRPVLKRIADHERGSLKSRFARWKELTGLTK